MLCLASPRKDRLELRRETNKLRASTAVSEQKHVIVTTTPRENTLTLGRPLRPLSTCFISAPARQSGLRIEFAMIEPTSVARLDLHPLGQGISEGIDVCGEHGRAQHSNTLSEHHAAFTVTTNSQRATQRPRQQKRTRPTRTELNGRTELNERINSLQKRATRTYNTEQRHVHAQRTRTQQVRALC